MAKHNIDITRETCPMTFVKVKLAMSKLSDGDTLEVLLNEGEPLENVPRSAEEAGFKVLSVAEAESSGQHKVVLEK